MAEKKKLPKGAKIAIVLVCVVAVILIIAVLGSSGGDSEQRTTTTTINNQQTITTTQTEIPALALVEQDGVRIAVERIGSTIIGEYLALEVDNARNESIVVTVSEVSVNGTMAMVIPPQAPMHITSAGMRSVLPFTFTDANLAGATVVLRVHVRNANFQEIFATNHLSIQL